MECINECYKINEVIEVIVDEVKENKKSIEQFLQNHADFISSSDEVVESKKGIVRSLGLTMPASRGEVVQQSNMPNTAEKYYLVTLNFPRDQKIRLNKKVNYKYSDYKTREQLMICNRITHYFESESYKYNVYYEYCKDGNLHIHCIIQATQRARDIKIDINRFFNINSQYFCDVREVSDMNTLKEYLTNKKEKAYQSSGIPPIINLI